MKFGFIFALSCFPLFSGATGFLPCFLLPDAPETRGIRRVCVFWGPNAGGSASAAPNRCETQGAGGFHIFCFFFGLSVAGGSAFGATDLRQTRGAGGDKLVFLGVFRPSVPRKKKKKKTKKEKKKNEQCKENN